MRLAVGSALAVVLAATACGGGSAATLPSQRPATTATAIASPTPVAAATRQPNDPCARSAGPTSSALPVADFGRVLADPANCYVYVSSPASNSIVVADYSGNVVKTIGNEYGADAMVVDGSSLYVALTTTGSIDLIDTKTLTRVKGVASGLVKPRDLAFAGGRLWTTSGECAQWAMRLASVEPAAGRTTLFDVDRNTNLSYCAGFASSTRQGSTLVAWDLGLEPGSITVFDVSGGRPVIVASKRIENLGNLQDAAITPAGDRLVTASGAPYEFDEWRLSDMTEDGVIYPGAPYPDSVAVSAVRQGLVATGLTQTSAEAVAEYELGKPAALAKMLTTGAGNNQLYARGLAFSRDGSLIFAVTGGTVPGAQPVVTLNLLPGPPLP